MAAEDFFSRWRRQRSEQKQGAAQADAAALPTIPVDNVAGRAEVSDADTTTAIPPPTEQDVQMLTPGADVSRYMQSDVNEPLRRMALKKLFSDPHFNVMDGLDIYIDDYTQPDPLPEGMLEKLAHAQLLLNPVLPVEIAEAGKANQTEIANKTELAASVDAPDDNAGADVVRTVADATISDALAEDDDGSLTKKELTVVHDAQMLQLPSSAHRSESKTG